MPFRVFPCGPLAAALFCALAATASAQPTNVVEGLQARLDKGEAKLAYADDGHGYLASVLEKLNVTRDSQLLVFSKSSLQFAHISPSAPRALYFGQDVSVGTVQGGTLLEIMTNDKSDGLRFYTLDVNRVEKPRLERRAGDCVTCHGFASKWSPGMLVANLDVGPDGDLPNVDPGNPFRLTYDNTPFEDRYGGWYVTGHTGAMRHRGNVTLDFSISTEPPPGGLNVTDLSGKIDTRRYLSPGSDIVALLTLEHQAGVVNQINQLNARQRSLTDATRAEFDAAIAELVRTLTFADAVPLPSPVTGSSSFTASFAKLGRRDSKGRSLSDFDLQTRLFRHPLSFMVYSDAFQSLDPAIRTRVWQRLHAVLQTTPEGQAAIGIVAATKPAGLPGDWR